MARKKPRELSEELKSTQKPKKSPLNRRDKAPRLSYADNIKFTRRVLRSLKTKRNPDGT